jgi:hypothetical protein
VSRQALLVPPLPRVGTSPGSTVERAPQAEAASPFALHALQVAPHAQRDASLTAESATEVGPADDAYEQEADAIAQGVMRMPADAEPGEEEAPEGVQRACAACEAEENVQRLSVEDAEREHGPPDLAASPGELTSGGAALGEGLQGFYESRLGRDLSGVRIHRGAPAEAMADSISARAFTYGSHIWLGRGEQAAPNETFSHEMAHVLQQTQPAAIGEEAAGASPAAAGAQRRARWVPQKPTAGQKDFEKSRGGAHDAVIAEVSKDPRNTDLLSEVPIPNAGPRSGSGKSNGFADFFKSTPALSLPGVILAKDPAAKATKEPEDEEADTGKEKAPPEGFTPGTPPDKPKAPLAVEPSVPAPPDHLIENFDEQDWRPFWFAEWQAKNPAKKADLAQPMKAGASFPVAGHQHPRVAGGKLVGVAQAPTTIALGELKPGHNVETGQIALLKQLPRYKRGLTKVKDAVNAVDPAQRDGTWQLGLEDIKTQGTGMSGLTIPDGLHPKAKAPTFSRTLELHVNGKPLPTPSTVTGHLAFGPHPTNAGVWSYAFIPANAPRAQTLTAGQRTSVKKLEKQLREIIAKLKKTPTKVKRRRRPAVAKARPAGRRVIRRDKKPNKDAFDRKAWETDRESLAAAFKSWKTTDPSAIHAIEQQEALREANEEIAGDIKGVTAPPASAQALADIKLLHKLERISDPKFGPLLGLLREKFGTVFVKLANAYDGFREKLAERMKRAPAGAPSGFEGWKKKAIRLLIKAATVGAKLLMQQVVQNFANCIDGLADQLVAKFEGELDERFGEEIEKIVTAFDTLRARIETELEPFLAQLDALFTMLSDVEKLASLITDMVTLARVVLQVASCLSPPLAGCLWGLAGQLGIEGALHLAVDQAWFEESVINPIGRKLIEPFADEAYKMILNALLGDPDTKTLRGTLADMVAKTPQCAVPTRGQMLSWSGAGGNLPVMDANTAGKAARGTAEQWHKDSAKEIDDAVKKLYRNADGTPASDEQIAALLDQMEKSRDGRKGAEGCGPLGEEGREDRSGEGARRRGDSVGPDAQAPETAPGKAGTGGEPSPGVADITRSKGKKDLGGKTYDVSWYGQLQTPPDKRIVNGPVTIDLYFPRTGRPTWRFRGLSVTFLGTSREAAEAGGEEQDWLRFSIAEPLYLDSENSQITINAGERRVMIVGEAAP